MSIVAQNLHVEIAGRPILRRVSIQTQPGEVVGLLGPNGAGKSTLIRALAGQVASGGAISVQGKDLAAMSHAERARLVAYLPQSRIIGWSLSVRDAVALGRLPWRSRPGNRDERATAIADRAMELMDIAHLAGRPANALSGGEQARVLAARAIAQDTPVLLADEPASGLDPAHQISMMAVFRKMAANGRSLLVSLHDLTLAARWCDRIVILKEGHLAASGTPQAVMTQDVMADVYGISVRIDSDACGLIVSPLGLLQDTAS